MSDLLFTLVSEFRGDFPDVPFAPGVDADAFKAEAKPFFVTLKIAKVGATSRNTGKPFSRAEVERVVQQVNEKRPEGNLGHVPKDKRGTEYGLPKLEWVGATLDERTGEAWGKAYVPNYATDVREFFMNKIRTNGRVGTSIYGVQGARGLADMTLESIDLGHPDRLGVPDVATVPRVTSELSDGKTEDKKVPTELEIVSELLTGQLQEKTNLVAELQQSKKTLEEQVADLTTKLAATDGPVKLVAEMRATLKADEKADVLKLVSEMMVELTTLKAKDAGRERDGWVAEFVALPDLRPIIAEKLGDGVKDKEGAKARVAELMKDPTIANIARALAGAKGGPPVIVTELGGDDKSNWRDALAAKAEGMKTAAGV